MSEAPGSASEAVVESHADYQEDEEEEEEDPEIAAMKKEIEALEKDVELSKQQSEEASGVTPQSKVYSPAGAQGAPTASIDENSVFVGGLNEMTGPDDLQNHFKACGTIKRITVLCDKWTKQPKGYAYIEFMEPKAAELALGFHETSIRGSTITVTPKRNNLPGRLLRGRGRGGFGGYPPRGGRGRGGYPPRGRGGFQGGYAGGYRGRYAPY